MTTDPIQAIYLSQIIIERVRGAAPGGIAWEWSAFGYDACVLTGHETTLSECLDDMRKRLRDEGFVP